MTVGPWPAHSLRHFCVWAKNCHLRAACYRVGMTVKAIIHRAEEGGFWAEVPALPGCVTQGETVDEIRQNLREAVEGSLEAGESESALGESDEILEFAV